jgi:hypothetical protein
MLVAALPISADRWRIALFDLAGGTSRWLVPDTGVSEGTPIFAPDSTEVLFVRRGASGDRGVFSVSLNGSSETLVRPPARLGALATLSGATPDGLLLGADQFNGSLAWVRDRANGRETSFGACCSVIVAARAANPRLLLNVTTSSVAPRTSHVALADARDGAVREVLPRYVSQASFDPAGTSVVFPDTSTGDGGGLVVLDVSTQTLRPLVGTEGARSPIWLLAGIVYVIYHPDAGQTDVRVVPTGGAPVLVRTLPGSVRDMRAVVP